MSIGDPNLTDEQKQLGSNDFTDIFYYLMPNWKFNVSLQYTFKTVLSITRRKREQRKVLYNLPIRILGYTLTDNERENIVWNYLKILHASIFFMPIYCEPCRVNGVGSLAGLTNIPIRNDVLNYYSLCNLTEYIIIIDLQMKIDCEVLGLQNVAANTLTVENVVIGNFNSQATVIFPLFKCYLTKKQRVDHSDKMTKFVLEFKES